MRTYTEHKLTNAQLRRLSAIVNNTGGARAGMAGAALERKGLIVRGNWDNDRRILTRTTPTDAGVAALAQARREGW